MQKHSPNTHCNLLILSRRTVLDSRRVKDGLLFHVFIMLIRNADRWRLKAEIIEEVTRASPDAVVPACFLFWPPPFVAALFCSSLLIPTFWLTPQLCIPQTFSEYGVFRLSQCDKPSSFNNCLFDISGSIKRFPNVTFPYSRAFTCLPLLDQWLCQVKKWRLEWRTCHCSLKGWYFRNEISDSLSPAPRPYKIPCASDFTDNVQLSSFQWCHLGLIRHKARLSPPQ